MLNVWGIVSISVFYVGVLIIGIWASRRMKKKSKGKTTETENMMVAGRNMNFCLSFLSSSATAVCGAYLTGTAEVVSSTSSQGGLVWCLMPVGAIAGVISGPLFAKPLRAGRFLTMIEPFEKHYNRPIGVLFAVISLFGEIMWTAAVMNALGATIVVVLDADNTIAVIVSACIVIAYTLLGGLYAVAYTDVVQLVAIFIGLWTCVPFALTNEFVTNIGLTASNFTKVENSTRGWLGKLETADIGIYVDMILMILFGGTPWSSWMQRMLACRTVKQAQLVAMISGCSFSLFSIPAALIGAIAASADWPMTAYNRTLTSETVGLSLPLVLQYLTPTAVAFIGLGAISAAVMSSADSTILAASSLFSQNVYRSVIRPKASDKEILWVIRGSMVVIGALATTLALVVRSVYAMYIASNEFAYILMFPQLALVLHWKKNLNTWGCLSAVVVGISFRLLLGDPVFGLPAIIKLPLFDEERQMQLLPIRTICAALTLITLIIVSLFVNFIKSKIGGHHNSEHSENVKDEVALECTAEMVENEKLYNEEHA